MALDVATLPLILYRKVCIPIEHILHCENIIHIPTLFYYLAIPTPFFHFQCFFYLFMPFFHYIVFAKYRYTTVNDTNTIEYVLHCENIIHIPIPCFITRAIPTPFFHFHVSSQN